MLISFMLIIQTPFSSFDFTAVPTTHFWFIADLEMSCSCPSASSSSHSHQLPWLMCVTNLGKESSSGIWKFSGPDVAACSSAEIWGVPMQLRMSDSAGAGSLQCETWPVPPTPCAMENQLRGLFTAAAHESWFKINIQRTSRGVPKQDRI